MELTAEYNIFNRESNMCIEHLHFACMIWIDDDLIKLNSFGRYPTYILSFVCILHIHVQGWQVEKNGKGLVLANIEFASVYKFIWKHSLLLTEPSNLLHVWLIQNFSWIIFIFHQLKSSGKYDLHLVITRAKARMWLSFFSTKYLFVYGYGAMEFCNVSFLKMHQSERPLML